MRPSPAPASRRCSSPISSAPPKLILASRSPQRRAILEQLGVAFEATPVDVEEREQGSPDAVASWNAERKAEAAAELGVPPDGVVMGADTVVALDGRIYGKPGDEQEARATLDALSGRTHEVVTAVVLLSSDWRRGVAVFTKVQFREIESALMDWYLASGEWRERAGGYAIQGKGAALVSAIHGDFFNVVGLPVAALLDLWPEMVHPAGL